MINNVNNFLVIADNTCDYVPFISTANNLIDLFLKCVVLPFLSREEIASSHYYTHLEMKSIFRCVVLLIPVIGNIIVGIYDFIKHKQKDSMLAAVRQNGWALQFAHEDLKRDRDVVLAAVRQNGLVLQFAHEDLRRDRDVVLAAIEQNPWALQFAHQGIREQIRQELANAV